VGLEAQEVQHYPAHRESLDYQAAQVDQLCLAGLLVPPNLLLQHCQDYQEDRICLGDLERLGKLRG
jgi:hypothetical protein